MKYKRLIIRGIVIIIIIIIINTGYSLYYTGESELIRMVGLFFGPLLFGIILGILGIIKNEL